MSGCLFLLALLLAPSAPNKMVDQRFSDLAEWLHRWKVLSSESQAVILQGQGQSLGRQVKLGDTLKEVVAEAVGVKAQLEELLVDFAELVKIAQATRNVTSQFLTLDRSHKYES